MNKSLLVSLQKYASRPSFNPIENFTTEAFAWLLRNDKHSEKAFIKLINEKINKIDENYLFKNDLEYESKFKWETQKSIKSGIVDIVGLDNKYVIVVEVKVDSTGNEYQLKNYVDDFQDGFTGEVVGVLLTSRYSQHTQKADCYLLWEDIYNCLKKIVSDDEKKERRQDFMDFLEYKDLSPKKIPFDMWRYAGEFSDYILHSKLYNCFDKIAKEENDFYTTNELKPIYQDNRRWGRTGITFGRNDGIPDNWNPAFFMGIIYDPFDHIYGELFNKGAIFCLIVSVGINYWEQVYKSPQWKNFILKLEKCKYEDCDSKNFLADIHESELRVSNLQSKARKNIFNPWHTFVIYKPMINVIKDHLIKDKDKKLVDILRDEVKRFSQIPLAGSKEYIDLINYIDNHLV